MNVTLGKIVIWTVVSVISLAFLLVPGFVGWKFVDSFIDSQREACRTLGSVVSEFSQRPHQGIDIVRQPLTQEHCIRTIEKEGGFTRVVFVGISYIAAGIIGGVVLLIRGITGRR